MNGTGIPNEIRLRHNKKSDTGEYEIALFGLRDWNLHDFICSGFDWILKKKYRSRLRFRLISVLTGS